MTHLEVVQAVRAQFPTPLYPGHSAAFLVALCQRLQQEFPSESPAGLRRKDAGMHTTLPDGTNVALDIVMYPRGAGNDVLADSDGAAIPTWNDIGDLPTDWYVPVYGSPAPEPPAPLSDDLARRLQALETQVARLETVTVKNSDTIALATAHGRFVRAGDEGLYYVLDQAPSVGAWERFRIFRP
jgi:hypothetical protein